MSKNSISVEQGTATQTLDTDTKLQRVHLFTHGVMDAQDGRVFSLDDAHTVIRETMRRAGKRELPIDFDHQIDFSATNGRPAPAAGWIKQFKVEDDGIWAVVEWTDIAAQVIQRKQYRYISPTFQTTSNGRILYILRAALTNIPALELTQIASTKGNFMANDDLTFQEKITMILGLENDTTEDTILSSLQALMNTDAAVDGQDVKAVASIVQTLNTERRNFQMARVRDKVGGAIANGVMPPSMRSWMTRLCANDEAAFDELLKGVGTPFENLFKEQITQKQIAALGAGTLDKGADEKIAKQLGIDPEKMR